MAETSEAKASASAPGGDAGGEEEKRDERMLECNICLDTARDAVVSMCGHLFWYVLLAEVAIWCHINYVDVIVVKSIFILHLS